MQACITGVKKPFIRALTSIRSRIKIPFMDTLTPSQQLAAIKTLTKLGEKAIGERIGCSQPTVNRILNGRSDCRGTTLLEIQKWHTELTASPTDAQPA